MAGTGHRHQVVRLNVASNGSCRPIHPLALMATMSLRSAAPMFEALPSSPGAAMFSFAISQNAAEARALTAVCTSPYTYFRFFTISVFSVCASSVDSNLSLEITLLNFLRERRTITAFRC